MSISKFFGFYACLMIVTLSVVPDAILAQSKPNYSDDYITPPESIAEEILAPRHEHVTLNNLSPNGGYFLNRIESGLPQLSKLAKPWYNIAGLQIDHRANRNRSMTIDDPVIGLELIDSRTGESRRLSTPRTATITDVSWSPAGDKLAYFAHYNRATHIYVATLESGQSERLTTLPALATLVTSFEWAGDGQSILTVLLPEERGAEPRRPQTPNAITVRTTTPEENRLRTYQSLLTDRHDANLLEYFVTGQLAKINVETKVVQHIGNPSMIRRFDTSPDGDHLIVQTMKRPFSYIVPVSRFGWTEEIWDLNGNVLTELRTSDHRLGVPDAEEVEDYGRRDIKWRPDGNGLSLLLKSDAGKDEEESDSGDNGDDDTRENSEPNEDDDATDRVIQWVPPFGENDQSIVYETDSEMDDVMYNDDSDILFITERGSENEKLYAVFMDEPDSTYTIFDYERSEFYEDPGNVMRTGGDLGEYVVRVSPNGENVYLDGTEYFEDFEENAPRPFVDEVNIRSGETTRIFQSSPDVYEEVASVLDDELNLLMLERETPTMIPNSWLYNRETEEMEQLTVNSDPNSEVTQAQRDRFKVKRADGFEFWMEVIMPQDWNGEPLPGLIWHYPREVDDQEDYDEGVRDYNKNRYPRIYARSSDIMIKEGYAVLQPDWPIAGDRGSSNDNFVWSIVQNSTAVIDSAEARGYIDRHKMAIGGHSYGAFGTSNAMIHTSFFKAGIAGAGNYNRTLTPLGFQREPNDLWRGLDKYVQMSPIFWADRLNGALLMYHSEADQNVGTWPTNSRRMFHALNGIGKDAALYMYPHEGHGPDAEQTLLDLWTRWVDWLDYYVKENGAVEE
ncbi:S9 family peptidase [Rhodohalobacter sp. 8-1]|uniref:S9 family peptidase n=1 Tax=Rhodohalobacter sp. 8-1 TaxID=3131972 RepID=UPI0030EBE920